MKIQDPGGLDIPVEPPKSAPSYPGRITTYTAKGFNVTQELINFIAEWEGVHLKAYKDIAGVWTIGIGHTEGFMEGLFHPESEISNQKAGELLSADLGPRVELVNKLVTMPIKQYQFDALLSFEFNTGGLIRSTALKRLNIGDYMGAAEALTWWNKATIDGKLQTVYGLTRRRAAERDMFLHGEYRGP